MKFGEYLKDLNHLVEVNPDCVNWEVAYASDDEGNEFNKVNSTASLVKVSNIEDNRFLEIENFEAEDDGNAVLLN